MEAMTTIGRITRTKEGILYEAPNWSKFVSFGLDRQHRAGGYAFREAAKEQDKHLNMASSAPS